ncbi:hypothetical protein V2A60_009642 [Cordyceps javanica]|uniref:Uncharacterized protein n=1 Tax=Cordyceps javanica TaxID=43265 RepID=A0A545V0S3_9HYPO|nr:hypothetical protein IF1G_06311 [Cordyceps javanica]TQW05479.1 hypothetical protein IF2G_06601 [Cordyceps javanica]
MGLPLFIAPVESDVSRKSANKTRTTSPSRTSIRRVDRAGERERQRNVVRRAAARIYGPVQRTLSTRDVERPLPWIESGTASSSTSEEIADLRSRLYPSLDNLSPEDARRSLRASQYMEEDMTAIYGSAWYDVPAGSTAEEQAQDTDLGWWSIDPRGRARRPRVQMTPISSRFTRSPDTMEAARARTSSPLAAENSSQVTESVRQRRMRAAHLARNAYIRRRHQSSRRGTGVDGLGDRERSLSPEGWDTLLTTLAPDPQPPSANTSFASGSGTQSGSQTPSQPAGAGAPTTQPSTAPPAAAPPSAVQPPTGGSILPDGFDDAPVDPGCDSGCEHSDIEEGDFAEARRAVAYRSRQEHYGRGATRSRFAQSANRAREAAQQRLPPLEHPDAPSMAERQALSGVPLPDVSGQDSWAGRASMGAAEQGSTNMTRHARTMSFSPGSGPAEEDWSGMQHIMRSLAQREDIPEEWWAEAGLSRTLSQQGTN